MRWTMSIEVYSCFDFGRTHRTIESHACRPDQAFLAKEYDEAKGQTEDRGTKQNEDAKNFLFEIHCTLDGLICF
jgi:hypothetical protein